ncbi:MAG: hypothetical protein WBP42_02470 [Candidatus Zixiibacteriota bacterium]
MADQFAAVFDWKFGENLNGVVTDVDWFGKQDGVDKKTSVESVEWLSSHPGLTVSGTTEDATITVPDISVFKHGDVVLVTAKADPHFGPNDENTITITLIGLVRFIDPTMPEAELGTMIFTPAA